MSLITSKKISKVYLGSKMLYSSGNVVTYHVDSNTKYTEEFGDGESVLSAKSFVPSKSGWAFIGWREDTIASGDVLSSKIMDDEPITLYAVFRQTVTVSYYQVSNSTKQQSTGNKYYNNGNYLDPSFTIYPNGYGSEWTFRGWTTDTAANASVTYADIINRKFSSDVTLYVLLQRPVTLTYDGAFANWHLQAMPTETKYVYLNSYGSNTVLNPTFTLASNSYSRPNYSFAGWDLGAVGSTITLDFDRTAYAQWTAINYYFDINGADNGLVDVYINGSLVASGVSDYYQQHPYGSTYEIKNIRPKSGYKYDGVTGGSLSGTITGATTVTLSFSVATTYAFQNGSLGSGISVSGASISGGKIFTHIGSGAWSDWEGDHDPEEAELVVTISGLDLTNYSKLYISSTHDDVNAYGEAYCNVGIDSANTRFFTGNDVGTVTKTITLDVSGYTGVHTLKFYLYARSDSSYSGYHTNCQIGITEIKLYN